MGVLEKRMSPDDINRAKSDARNWRATATSRPAPTAPPAADYSRTAPVVPAPAATSAAPAATPTQTTAAPTPQPSKSPDNPMDAFSKNFSKDDVDDFLKEMPRLRKKYGF
jgi:hypothetical protein